MEKPTQADSRKEHFARQAKVARDLADLALNEIDEALAGYVPPVHSELYELWEDDPNLHPIHDGDKLAQPIGYFGAETI